MNGRRRWGAVSGALAWVWGLPVVGFMVSAERTIDALTAMPLVTVVVVALALWSARRLPAKMWTEVRTIAQAKRNRMDFARYVLHRPPVAAAIAAYETSLIVSSQLDGQLKWLASLKTSSRVGCPF